MKIIFICGGLEPGKDGVGDYTRRLAGELIENRHQVCILAINDKFISADKESLQFSNASSIPTLRLSGKNSFRQRLLKGSKWIDNFNPEWLSLQYVPFSFQNKGLPLWLGNYLAVFGRERKWHIMFHELWLGMEKEASFKYKLWGRVQKIIIRRTIQCLSPKVISTQSRLHLEHLKEMGVEAGLLPLYSNIEVFHGRRKINRKKELNFLLFGTIYPGAPVGNFARELANYSRENNLFIRFTFLGRCREGLEDWVNVLKKNNFSIKILGEQPSSKISEVISKADWGISSTPFFQYEKSGTVAAMQEHGLPVYCVSRKFTPTVSLPNFPREVKEYKPEQLDLRKPVPQVHKNNLKRTAHLFIESLSA